MSTMVKIYLGDIMVECQDCMSLDDDGILFVSLENFILRLQDMREKLKQHGYFNLEVLAADGRLLLMGSKVFSDERMQQLKGYAANLAKEEPNNE